MVKNSPNIPETSSNFCLNLTSCALFFFAVAWLKDLFPRLETVSLVLAGLVISVIPLWIYDVLFLRVQQRPSAGIKGNPGQPDLKRIVVKLIGLYSSFLFILFIYKFNPVYYVSQNAADFYGLFLSVIERCAPWILIGSAVYFWFVDRRQKDPYDEYWQVGCLLTGRFKEVNRIVLAEYGRSWFIKAFFTPFMFGLLVNYTDALHGWNWDGKSFLPLYDHLLDIFYAVDILFGVMGYVLALRILDTHIQSTEPTLLGWVSCLACYSPFYAIFGIGLLPPQNEQTWDVWLAAHPALFYACGFVIIVLSLIYALATVAIGYRMSNLTYRGLITSGPYRFTKHPAYVSKVASWWLVSLPFLSTQGAKVAVIHTLSMIVITLIYYIRAKTEENHLSNYPEYVEYANWINEHGLFASLGRMFPALQYSEQKAKKSKSVVWFKKIHK